MARTTKAEQADAITQLRGLLPPGTTVYTVLRHRAASGMLRAISAVIIEDGAPRDISYLFGRALGWPLHPDKGGVKVVGSGMDMGFHLVESIASLLYYRDGYRCPGGPCRSSDHQSRRVEDAAPDGPYRTLWRPGPPADGTMTHHDGYAIIQRAL